MSGRKSRYVGEWKRLIKLEMDQMAWWGRARSQNNRYSEGAGGVGGSQRMTSDIQEGVRMGILCSIGGLIQYSEMNDD